jgi:hypothetical protein
MHMMFDGVMHLTVLLTLAFFVLFAASKAEGFVALLGRLLGYWFLLLAVLSIVAAVMFHLTGGKFMGMDMKDHPGWMHHWDREGPPPAPTATPSAQPPAKDTTPPTPPKKG